MKPVVVRAPALLLASALPLCWHGAAAVELSVSGRVSVGSAWRTEAADPQLLVPYNAAAMGLEGRAAGGQNTDDANNNYRKGDMVSRVLKGHLDLRARAGTAAALVRVKAWRDFALLDDPRPWGNNPNGYVPDTPLSDAGAGRLGRFAGIALADAYVEDTLALGDTRLFVRAGRQTLAWGERNTAGGGMAVLNALDLAAQHRPGALPAEFRIAQPMLFTRLQAGQSGLALEGYVQTGFHGTTLDMCGTFWAPTDYMADGCERAFAGLPAASDRARLQNGAYIKRIASPFGEDGAQFGLGMVWKSATPGSEIGLYRARYHLRAPMPGLRKAGRAGPGLIPGDPDGLNLAYFAEHPAGIDLYALSATHKQGTLTWSGEFDVRPNQPVQLPPADVLTPFLNATAPALLRADAAALAPGAPFHGYDRYRTTQLQLALHKEFGLVARAAVGGEAGLVVKHVAGLPDPAVRRYGRSDVYGAGPVAGVCNATAAAAARQCSLDGYVTPSALEYRLRLDARWRAVLPRLDLGASALFTHDVKGWSHDFLINQGRRTLHLGLQLRYRERYFAELAYVPVWGGSYNYQSDRDYLSVAAGVSF